MLEQDMSYTCEVCGEEIVVPVDLTAGAHQDYTEDCPVCCHPNVLHVLIEADGRVSLRNESEADRF